MAKLVRSAKVAGWGTRLLGCRTVAPVHKNWASTTPSKQQLNPALTQVAGGALQDEAREEVRLLARELLDRDKRKDELDLSFEDHNAAFKSKTTMEVVRALVVFQLCGINKLVDNNEILMKLGQKMLGKKLFGEMMKRTFYGQFVAGPDTVGITPTIARMHSFGVKSILDYSVEEDISQEEAEQREMDSCVSRVDSQRAKSPIPGIVEDKQFAGTSSILANSAFSKKEIKIATNLNVLHR